jgi:predicted MFS family arabinose efflux permease
VLNPSEVKKRISTPGYAWIILTVAFLASIAAALNMLKVPPLMPILIDVFKINMSSAGLMISVFAITGVLLSLPAGAIIQKLGIKLTGIIAMAVLFVGCVMGALTTSYRVFLVSRAVEGVGFALIAVVAPAALAMWFPREKLAVPMGIWATWLPLGGALVMVVGPQMAHSMGWQSVWWFGGALSLLSLVLLTIFLRTPPSLNSAPPAGTAGERNPSIGKALANRNIWLLAMAFAFYGVACGTVFNFYTAFLAAVRGFGLEKAAMTTSLGMIGLMIGSPLGGFVIVRIGRLKLSLSICLLIFGATVFLLFHSTGALIPIWMVLNGLAMGFISTLTFTAAPGIMGNPQLAGLGLAAVMLGQNLAALVGPLYFGAIVDKAGWDTGVYALLPAVLIGFVLTRMTKFAE